VLSLMNGRTSLTWYVCASSHSLIMLMEFMTFWSEPEWDTDDHA